MKGNSIETFYFQKEKGTCSWDRLTNCEMKFESKSFHTTETGIEELNEIISENSKLELNEVAYATSTVEEYEKNHETLF